MSVGSCDDIWSEEQWSKVKQTVHNEALRARVAASFLPLYGPLPADTEVVPCQRLGLGEAGGDDPAPGQAEARLEVDDHDTLRLATISVNVYLRQQQMADPELSSALIMFQRAADIVARIEDAIIFNGQIGVGDGPARGIDGVPPVFTISGGGAYSGLANAGDSRVPVKADGESLVAGIVRAIADLEGDGHQGPFACVLGDGLFVAANTPVKGSMVLPRDRILPFLDGPLLRSSTLDPKTGVVVSLQGNPVEIVVPSDIGVRYLQTTFEPRCIFRVSQRFVLRVKESQAIVTLVPG